MDNRQEDEGQKTLQGMISLGVETLTFMESPIGKFLQQRVEADVEDAVEALKTVDPEDAKTIRGLQSVIAVREQIMYWLAEAIQQAHNAQRELEPTD